MDIIYVEWQGAGEYAPRLNQYYQRIDVLTPGEYERMGFEPEEVVKWSEKPVHLLSRWVLDGAGREARLSHLQTFVFAITALAGFTGAASVTPTAVDRSTEAILFANWGVAHLVVSRRVVFIPSDDWGVKTHIYRSLQNAAHDMQQAGHKVYLSANFPTLIFDFPEYGGG